MESSMHLLVENMGTPGKTTRKMDEGGLRIIYEVQMDQYVIFYKTDFQLVFFRTK
jgi:hypothetical protein